MVILNKKKLAGAIQEHDDSSDFIIKEDEKHDGAIHCDEHGCRVDWHEDT